MLNRHFREMLSALAEEEVEFLVIGAYALAAHGVPRATGDLDFWIRSSEQNAQRLLRALERFGAPTEDLSVEDFTRENIVVQIGREPSRIDFLTTIDGVEFREAWREKVEVELEGVRLWVLSRNHLVQNKRSVGRTRDLADIEQLESSEKDEG